MAKDNRRTAVCIGTGPSLTTRQIDVARAKGFALFGCNHVFVDAPDLDVLYGCNLEFWQVYCEQLIVQQFAGGCWTSSIEAHRTFPWVHYITPIDKPGLAPRGDNVIHHGHSTGYQLVGLAYAMGYERIVLLGYDLKYAKDYDGPSRRAGSRPRHYFGEYADPRNQHWPSKAIKDGVWVGLCDLYQTIADQGAVEIINCSADSALDCFPRMPIEAVDPDESQRFLRAEHDPQLEAALGSPPKKR